MTQYLLSVHYIEGQEQPSADEMARLSADVDALNDEIRREGAWVFGGGLHTPDTAYRRAGARGRDPHHRRPVPRGEGADRGILDHPGRDLDGALAWAAKATRACKTPVEVRPFDEPEG
jgi:hypothetical protein